MTSEPAPNPQSPAAQRDHWIAECATLGQEIAELRETMKRLCHAAYDVCVKHFDTDDMSPEVFEMQAATMSAQSLLERTRK